LTEIANCFYQTSSPAQEHWVCLEIDTTGLKVFGIEVKLEEAANDPELKCAHIFGGLPKETIRKVYDVKRNTDGEFISVKGLTDNNPSCGCSSSNNGGAARSGKNTIEL